MSRKLSVIVVCLVVIAVAFASSGIQSTAAQGKSHYVGFVPPAFTSPFHVAMADGAKALALKKGWKIDVQAPASEGDFAGQVTIVQQLIQKGVEAISVNPINVDAMTTGVKAANAAKVPFFFHNFITPLSDPSIAVASYVGYDQWGGAEKLGQYTCTLLAKKYNTTPEMAKGKVFILLGIESIFSHRRTQGYKAGLAMCPNVQVVGEQTAEWLREKGASVATAALQKTPDIDVFYGNSDEMNIGAALAAEKLGLKIGKDYFSIGIDGNQPTLDLIKQGKITATLGVDPTRMGEAVINAMEKIFNGETVPQVLLTPSVIVDSSNIDDYLAGKTWTDPVGGAPEVDNGKPTVDKTAGAAGTMAATAASK
jgi:ABC-type sugar transport system substrate-binding protein